MDTNIEKACVASIRNDGLVITLGKETPIEDSEEKKYEGLEIDKSWDFYLDIDSRSNNINDIDYKLYELIQKLNWTKDWIEDEPKYIPFITSEDEFYKVINEKDPSVKEQFMVGAMNAQPAVMEIDKDGGILTLFRRIASDVIRQINNHNCIIIGESSSEHGDVKFDLDSGCPEDTNLITCLKARGIWDLIQT